MDFEAARASLIEHLRREIRDERVLGVMERIPRERFVPSESRYQAYEDRPLPIGEGQTISQPFIVALMTQEMEIVAGQRVLELGTGSGYQVAVLAELAGHVVSVERLPKLAHRARQILDELGYTNIEIHLAEKAMGWPAAAPYEAIMVTAGAPKIPQELLDQLAMGGRLVIPVGSRYEQELVKVTKRQDRDLVEKLGACRFVPLIGDGAWEEE
ncbi:MAG: protein-L-isoaspartate(D-aspartate) O-methyltransferase [Dehalococcoidia bacterium]